VGKRRGGRRINDVGAPPLWDLTIAPSAPMLYVGITARIVTGKTAPKT